MRRCKGEIKKRNPKRGHRNRRRKGIFEFFGPTGPTAHGPSRAPCVAPQMTGIGVALLSNYPRFLCTVCVNSSACCALRRRLCLRYTAPRGNRRQWPPLSRAALHRATGSRTRPERCTLDAFVITPIEPPGSLYAGPDHGRLFINEARTGVMAWWSMGRWTDRAAREAIIAHAMTMTL